VPISASDSVPPAASSRIRSFTCGVSFDGPFGPRLPGSAHVDACLLPGRAGGILERIAGPRVANRVVRGIPAARVHRHPQLTIAARVRRRLRMSDPRRRSHSGSAPDARRPTPPVLYSVQTANPVVTVSARGWTEVPQ
jgi:hypothetical protein